MLSGYNSINIQNLIPDTNKTESHFHQLKWTLANTEKDTIVAAKQESFSLNYYAIYFSNSEWISGKLHFHLFGNTEIYIDGVKKSLFPKTNQPPGKFRENGFPANIPLSLNHSPGEEK